MHTLLSFNKSYKKKKEQYAEYRMFPLKTRSDFWEGQIVGNCFRRQTTIGFETKAA